MIFSAAQLNARPYGDQQSHSGIKTAEQLNEMEYGTAPFAAGLTAEDYRVQHEAHGEPFRYWDATPLPDATASSNRDGLLFAEVEIAGKARFFESTNGVADKDFGTIPQGATKFSCLPLVVEVRKDCRILRTHPRQAQTFTQTLRRGSSAVDALNQQFVSAIVKVLKADGSTIPLANVEAVPANGPGDSDTGGIRWLNAVLSTGEQYTVVFKAQPLYVCLWESYLGSPVGADGERLPQRVLLKKERE